MKNYNMNSNNRYITNIVILRNTHLKFKQLLVERINMYSVKQAV